MTEEEKKLIEKFKNLYIKDFKGEPITSDDRLSYIECSLITNLIEKQQKELEQEKEKNKKLEEIIDEHRKTNKVAEEKLDNILKVFESKNNLNNYISKDKIKERMEQNKKVYDEEMKPYMIEVGNGEKVLNVTGLNKKEKEELINKRNCLLVQIKTYEMLLEEK